MAGEEVYVDWRGNAVDERRHGGIRATLFLYALFMLRSCTSSSNFSMVAYFHRTLHLDIVTSSTVISYMVGTVMISTALMNFISDAYIRRTTAIFVFSPFVILHCKPFFTSLHPEICAIDKEPNNCEPAQGWNFTLLYLSLLMFAVGEGCLRACIPSLGGDQFSNSDPNKSQHKSMFLTWIKFANNLGAVIGLVFLVWIENNWKPTGTPLSRTLQVLIISSNKRPTANANVIEVQETIRRVSSTLLRSNQTDETKVLIQMLPIFIGCYLIYLPFTLLMTLTIQVGSTMDRGAGTIQIPSASLIAIPTAFHMLMRPCYSWVLTPVVRKTTGHEHGITPLQCIGAGSACGVTAACAATLVEAKRLKVAEQHELTSAGSSVPMSVFWLVIQFFLLSTMDIASFGGLAEFIKSEASSTLKPAALAVQSFLAGLAAWSCCAFIQFVNRMTRSGDSGRGWLDGTNFNRAHLDHFFLLLGVVELVALINYTFWARRYSRKLQRINTVGLDEDNSRN
ncbi:hypothetical protein BS78_06G143800 [Paspalum vaginatum]|nr:hypothetical protein BS78_06G143800 [Paspalum vaginatum]